MNQENQNPGSLEEVRQRFFKKIWTWISVKPIGYKIASGVCVIILLIVAARLNFFAEPWYKYARLIIPVRIANIDPVSTAVPLILSYKIEDERGLRAGKLGDTAYSGNRIYISFNAGIPSWITVFGVDVKREPYPAYKGKLGPIFITANKPYNDIIYLDETTGKEVIYAIAATDEFDFDADIRPLVDKVFSKIGSKGAVSSEYQMELPEKFTQEFVYFNHLPKK